MTHLPSFHIIIPARFASTRLPGKVLIDIAGKPMLQHVYERSAASGATSVVIAVDHPEVENVAKKMGAQVCMTSTKHPSGSERLAEVIEKLGYAPNDIIINVQGDEPFISPYVIQQVAEDLHQHSNLCQVSTLYDYINQLEDLQDPSVVKAILDHKGYALYFSRSPIPWISTITQEAFPQQTYLRHIGLYAYRAGFLQQYVRWNPSAIEKMESLEQLRILWYGARIHAVLAQENILPGINTKEDLERVKLIG